MRVVVAADRTAVARHVADHVERFVDESAPAALGIATGATMEGPIAEIVRRHREGKLSLRRIEVYLLDEYIGLGPEHPQTFANTIDRLLVQHTDLRADAVHAPNPHNPELDTECADYERRVRDARIGLQLLGIGTNGHIAFNEPGAAFASTTRVVELSHQTRLDNARFFESHADTPQQAITQGISTILAADELLLVACGESKACTLARAVRGPANASAPASALQLHANVTVAADPQAAALLGRDAPTTGRTTFPQQKESPQ